MPYALPQSIACQPAHFLRHAVVGRSHDDLTAKATVRQCHCDRQAMVHLMNLVVIEQKAMRI